ncbi:MAG: MFS transporter [Pseudohongiellaceae bacterium]
MTDTATHTSPWSPLKITTFRYLWLATLVSNIGTWMHEVGAGWLMSELTTSAVLVSLMQTATALPAFFILLPSGALSDILDRRLYLLGANLGMAAVAVTLGVLTISGLINEWSLLGLTLCLGIGTALIMPTWQSIIPEVVPRTELKGAIGLNTLGMNVSRVLGSLIAGGIIAVAGSGVVFICNALTFIFIIGVLVKWRRIAPDTRLPPERFLSAIKTGLRYTRHSPALQSTIFRSIGFYFFASVMWALLPLIARELLQGNELTYSSLFAAISVGAIGSALLLPRFRLYLNNDQLITSAALVFAAGIVVTATVPIHLVALIALFFCGGAWITVMTSAQLSAQTALPNWVRSRGISVFLTCFMGSLAIGPVVWGGIADLTDLPTAMIIASTGLAIASFYTRRWPVSGNEAMDHTPSGHWRIPEPVTDIDPHQGPVMITIRYEVDDQNLAEFLRLMELLGKSRKRDGAFVWGIMQDTTVPGVYLEYYLIESWLDHLRQHERISRQDAAIQHQIRSLLVADTAPVITHYVKPLKDAWSQ